MENTVSIKGVTFQYPPQIEGLLIELARGMQDNSTISISYPELLKLDTAEELLRAAVDAHILLDDGTSYRFVQPLFQEYFAMRSLLQVLEVDEAYHTNHVAQFFGEQWWDAGVWSEPMVTLGDFLGGVDGANRVASWLAAISPEVACLVILKNAAGLTLANDLYPDTRRLLLDSAHEKIQATDPPGRAAAYRVLALLDADDRPGIGVKDGLPDIEWVKIPAGEFSYLIGTETIPYDYEIARYPVTYAQFQAFVDAEDGYQGDRWWQDMPETAQDWDGTKRVVRELDEQSFKFSNHPREKVSWFQAMAFCRWLSYRMTGEMPTSDISSWVVRLPTEYEWEKAARAETGWQYPCGDEFDATKGNTEKTGIRKTSAVGIFSTGAAPHWDKLIDDLSGNVWEWCLTEYDHPSTEIAEHQLSSRRVLRGGSWYGLQVYARAAYRYGSLPDNRSYGSGFRLCRPSSR